VGDLERAVRHVAPIRFHQRIGRALDASLDPERFQQMSNEGRLAGAERAVQLDEGVAKRRSIGKADRSGRARGLVRPVHLAGS